MTPLDTRRILEALGDERRPSGRRKLSATSLAGREGEATEWAIDRMVPLGVLTALAGRAGIAKSTVLALLTAYWTHGMLPGDLKGKPTNVMIVSGEDDIDRQLVPRLRAAGADMDRVRALEVTLERSEDEEVPTVLDLAQDLGDLEALIQETDTRILIVDPIVSFIDGNPDRVKEVRNALDPLAAMARRLNIAVIVVGHFRKSGAGPAGDMMSGSHAWRDIVRSLIIMAKDPESDERVTTVDKLNYGKEGLSWAYNVETVDVPVGGGLAAVGRAVLTGESDTSVHDLIDREREGAKVRNAKYNLAHAIRKVVEAVQVAQEGSVSIEQIYAAFPDEEQNAVRTNLSRLVKRNDLARTTHGLYEKFRLPFEPED
ncbi:AAA family ATPase [Microbacterium sp. CFH 31415]|uniref:AAA family ATPase n=1 Tax=Microbacterium sp. CFH 31415 TaxID=2921732 RepID=UPI001F143041|nr:AAA family ATPase [Microbacterium sp. CFH 31415]MCH6229338.1 AAA family ATPase [Microbacterium sp. CFH 31415]